MLKEIGMALLGIAIILTLFFFFLGANFTGLLDRNAF